MKMKAKYIITLENKQEIEAARKRNKDKNVEKRLLALSLRSDGKTLREIAEIAGYNCIKINTEIKRLRDYANQHNRYTGVRLICTQMDR